MMGSSSAKSYYDFASNVLDDAYELINNKALHERLHDKIFFYQSIILSKYIISNHLISPMGIHPDCAFAHLYRIENAYMPEEVLSFFWYLCTIYTICIILDIQWRCQYINAHQGQKDCFSTFLTWLAPLSIWRGKLRKSAKATGLPFKKLKSQGSLNPFFNPQTIYFFHRPVQINNKSGKIHVLPTLIHHNNYQRGVRPDFNINDKKVYEAFILMRSVLTMPEKHFSFFLSQIGPILQAATKRALTKIFNFYGKTSKSTSRSRGPEDGKARASVPRIPTRILSRLTAA
ncbi:hypothetical protein F2Q69_00048094 [Brassica cretica]|uniref:Uncharacterized protein n=1 Tax=Brassica cretica TaxID=69181 RepID=A0A8S9PP57_BRACR|nr:hypothetical protein F2Q69_00048094 [Brassica cretica]